MRNNRKGFTIVELVIVIAVIAVLAAVLIPTFVSLTRKANLNSDMQAVRQMNLALAAAEATGGKAETIDQAMKIIADAGYDVDAWSPLTSGYQVYWYKAENRCILYNGATAQVEFPKDFDKLDLNDPNKADQFFVYNQTFVNATKVDLTYNSSNAKNETVDGITYENAVVQKTGNEAVYSSLIVQEKENKLVYTVQNVISDNATAEQKKEAQQAAGDYVYALFTQMNLELVDNSSRIEIAPGTTIDVSHKDWKPVKLFTGYFGSSDPEKPVVIDGLKVTDTVNYTQTYTFRGSNSLYYCSGFIGAIYGNATIENVTFKNITIDRPAKDGILLAEKNNSNTTALIGGIVRPADSNGETNVTIKNVHAENCKITGEARTAGLIGFIGGYQNAAEQNFGLKGTINIEKCSFDGEVTSALVDNDYATAGGLIGFINKNSSKKNDAEFNGNLTINIRGCKVSGKVSGSIAGGLIANFSDKSNVTVNITDSTSTAEVVGNCNNSTVSPLAVLMQSPSLTLDGVVVTNGAKNVAGALIDQRSTTDPKDTLPVGNRGKDKWILTPNPTPDAD